MQVIIYTNESGGVSVCSPTGELSIEEVKTKDTPNHSIIIDAEDLPNDFFDAWELSGSTVSINVDKAKDIAHTIRRAKRAEEFAPLDILATIPNQAATAEIGRQAIRDKYAAMQTQINLASTPEEIKEALN